MPEKATVPATEAGRSPTAGSTASLVAVEVALATPTSQQVVALRLPAGCTAREAVEHALAHGLDPGVATDIDPAIVPLGIFGERVPDERPLVAGDRVELYRPLQQDPRERRRRRAAEAAATADQRRGG